MAVQAAQDLAEVGNCMAVAVLEPTHLRLQQKALEGRGQFVSSGDLYKIAKEHFHQLEQETYEIKD